MNWRRIIGLFYESGCSLSALGSQCGFYLQVVPDFSGFRLLLMIMFMSAGVETNPGPSYEVHNPNLGFLCKTTMDDNMNMDVNPSGGFKRHRPLLDLGDMDTR